MDFNQKRIDKIAFIITLVIHLVILAIKLPSDKPIIPPQISKYKVPIQLNLTKPEPIKEVKKLTPKPSKKYAKATLKKKKKKRKKKKPKPKPKKLPGDRSVPLLLKGSATKPIYPKKALNNELEGTVKVLFTINEKGTVIKSNIITSSGHAILDTMFLKTVEKYWKFKPKRILGKNKHGKIELSYTFSLKQ